MAIGDGTWKEREPSALLGRHLSLFFPNQPTSKFLKLEDSSSSVSSACERFAGPYSPECSEILSLRNIYPEPRT